MTDSKNYFLVKGKGKVHFFLLNQHRLDKKSFDYFSNEL